MTLEQDTLSAGIGPAAFGGKRPTLDLSWTARTAGMTERRLVPVLPAASAAGEERPRNAIAVGDRLRLSLRSDVPGYLHFFDFGTSGRSAKLFPCPALSTVDNRIEAGRTYSAPGELLPIPDFLVSGPTTAETGRKERLLVVVTRNPIELPLSAVEPAAAAFATRGGFAAVEEAVGSLLDLPAEDWTYGLLETEVING